MTKPRFSVIIPAYNQAEYLGDAIQSVLNQTDPNFELIIVNDSSPDDTDEVIKQFADSRIKTITHTENKGLPATRNTGMKEAVGEFIVLLDSDDYLHTEKLKSHASFFDVNPHIDITYNCRFNLHHSSSEIRTIYRPPAQVELKDLIMGFPFSPSDMVFRKSCIQDVGVFNSEYKCGGEDFDFPLRMALAEKKFARIDKVLNFRRYHSNRKRTKLLCRVGNYVNALDQAFSHPNFPLKLFSKYRYALANRYLEVACWALYQSEYSLGNDILHEIYLLAPEYIQGNSPRIANELLTFCTRDFQQDHATLLKNISKNIHPQFSLSNNQLQHLIAKGFFKKASLALIWDYSEDLELFKIKTLEMKSYLNTSELDDVITQLVIHAQVFGEKAHTLSINKIKPFIQKIYGIDGVRYICGYSEFNQAFSYYYKSEYSHVLIHVLRAIRSNPTFIKNRGLWKITIRSILRLN